MYLGFVALGASLPLAYLSKASNGSPVNADAVPTYRIYGPDGLMANGTGSLSLKDSKAITGATNANPIVITSAAHGLTTGTLVTISGVGGNTNANGTFAITVLSANTFSIPVTGNSAYTSGGTWNVAGLYGSAYTVLANNGFVQGQTYSVLTSAAVSAVAQAELDTFTVI